MGKILDTVNEMVTALEYYDKQKKFTFEPPNNFRAKTPARKALEMFEQNRLTFFKIEIDEILK